MNGVEIEFRVVGELELAGRGRIAIGRQDSKRQEKEHGSPRSKVAAGVAGLFWRAGRSDDQRRVSVPSACPRNLDNRRE